MNDMILWVSGELEKRGWSKNELSKRMGMSSGAVSTVLSGQRQPTWEFCFKLAQALDKSPIYIFRLAQLLPPESRNQQIEDRVQFLLHKLTSENQTVVLAMLDGLANIDIPTDSAASSISPEDQRILDVFHSAQSGERERMIELVKAFHSLLPHEREAVVKMIDTLAKGH